MGLFGVFEKILLGKPELGKQISMEINKSGLLEFKTPAAMTAIPQDAVVCCKYKRCTLAEVKAGVTILDGVPGYKIRVVQCGFTAIGGTGGGADSVVLKGTVAGSSANLATVLIAALAENVYHEIGFTNETPTLWVAPASAGTTFAGCDAGTPITLEDVGAADLDTLTDLDVVLRYCLDKA